MPLKKILIIIISLLLVILIWLLYNIWQGTKKDNVALENNIIKKTPLTSSVINTTQPQKLQQLTTRPILGLTIADQKLKYFDKTNGHIFEMALDGTREQEITSNDISGLLDVIWDQTSSKAIIQTRDKQYFYDFLTNQVILAEFKNPVWFKDQILDQCSAGVCQSDPDGFNEKIILKTSLKDFNIVSDNQAIYIYQKTSAKAPSIVYQLNPFKKILGPYYGLIFKSLNNYSIGLEPHATIADKCVSQNNIIFCAVPQNLDKNILMPDDYYKNLIATKDSFWQFDGQNKKEIAKTPYDAENLLIFENKLFFTDRTSGYLYMIKLAE